jgi:hypothetical protein
MPYNKGPETVLNTRAQLKSKLKMSKTVNLAIIKSFDEFLEFGTIFIKYEMVFC